MTDPKLEGYTETLNDLARETLGCMPPSWSRGTLAIDRGAPASRSRAFLSGMTSSSARPVRSAIALLLGLSLALGCSSAGSGPDDAAPPVDVEGDGTGDTAPPPAIDPTAPDPEPSTPVDDPSTQPPEPPAPEPGTTTTVDVEITVPSYVSDTLEVRLTWADKDIAATPLGDEFWRVTDTFPTDTANLLSVTFRETDGDITLGRAERPFRTGTDDLEIVVVTADQFDTDGQDDDGDGVGNLDELIAGSDPSAAPRVLLFSETRGFRHDSIEDALTALEALAASAGIRTERAADSEGVFTDARLADHDAVVWVLTSGDVLDADEQSAFERYIRSGRGYMGIHAASDTEYDWPWYGDLVGAHFARHPAIQPATQRVEIGDHPSTAHLGALWTRTDEWYDYRRNPRARVNVLLSLDEDSYTGGEMGEDHPSAWYHAFDGGRSWYTGGGHTAASYAEPDFRAHLLGGLRHAIGRGEPGEPGGP